MEAWEEVGVHWSFLADMRTWKVMGVSGKEDGGSGRRNSV